MTTEADPTPIFRHGGRMGKTPDFTEQLVVDIAKHLYSKRPLPYVTWDDLSDIGKRDHLGLARELVGKMDAYWRANLT